MQLSIRQATLDDTDAVADILREAADWLEDSGMPMWRKDELQPNNVAAEVQSGLFFLAECDGEPAGAIRYQLEDKLFWPDVAQGDSAFIHRLAIKRRFAGGEVSSALLLWAIAHSRARPALPSPGLRGLPGASASALRAPRISISQRQASRPLLRCKI